MRTMNRTWVQSGYIRGVGEGGCTEINPGFGFLDLSVADYTGFKIPEANF